MPSFNSYGRAYSNNRKSSLLNKRREGKRGGGGESEGGKAIKKWERLVKKRTTELVVPNFGH